MSIIAIVSMKGGVGKTSTTANLAAAVAEMLGDGKVAAIDLDPQNSLRLHFGVNDEQGVCAQSLNAGNWREIASPSAFRVTCLPYGNVSEEQREQFETLLEQQPNWVGEQLTQAGWDLDKIVFIDTPPGPSVYLRQAFACADLVIIVLLADAGSFITIPAMESWLHDTTQTRPDLPSLYLLNQIDSASLLKRDIAEVLKKKLAQRLIPVGIHSDEAVSEAMAFQKPVLFYDPHCQATQDLRRLANWLLEN